MTFFRPIKFLLTELVVLVALSGCTFEPEGEFFKQVKEISPSAVIDLADYNDEDTIVMIQPATFKYRVAISEPSSLQELQIVLDSTVILSSSTPSGEFMLSQASIPLGVHTLTLQFVAKSNSGSLADKAGVEYFQVWKSWILKVERFDNDPPEEPELKISEQNGFLRVDWTPYTKNNFVEYRLKIFYPYQREIVFSDKLSTFWVDSSFLWGQASYELRVTNIYGSAATVIGLNEPQEFTATYNGNDSSAVLKWIPSRFYNAFGSVVITENQTPRQTILNASDSTLTLKLNEVLWGRSESVMLQVFPKNTQLAPFEDREFFFDLVPASRLRGQPTLYYQDGIKKTVGFSPTTSLFYFYDDQMRVTDSATVYTAAVSVPYSGNYVYYVNNNMVVRWNLVTNEKVYTNDAPNFVIEPTSIYGSSNGLVSYYSMNHQFSWDVRLSHVVQNTDDKTFIQKTNVTYDPKTTLPPRSHVLSDEGNLLCDVYPRTIYKTGTGMPLVGSIPQIGSFFCFRHDNEDEILLRGTGSIYAISSQDMSLIRTITIPAGASVVSYDPVTHYVVCTKPDSDVVYLVNVDTNHTKTFPAVSSQWSLVNGYLINYAGEYMKVL